MKSREPQLDDLDFPDDSYTPHDDPFISFEGQSKESKFGKFYKKKFFFTTFIVFSSLLFIISFALTISNFFFPSSKVIFGCKLSLFLIPMIILWLILIFFQLVLLFFNGFFVLKSKSKNKCLMGCCFFIYMETFVVLFAFCLGLIIIAFIKSFFTASVEYNYSKQ